jgi:prefoldin subunit 5
LQGDLDKERNNFAQEKQKLNQDNANLRELVTKMQKSIDTLRQEKNELEHQKALVRNPLS